MRIGVDLGGTKTALIALDDSGDIRFRAQAATPQGDYDKTVLLVRDLVSAAESAAGRTGSVGIGTPGAISPVTGLIKNANSTCLNGRPLDRDLAAALERPIRLANDADCLTLSEATDGAGADAPVVFGVILGTGVGGGIAVQGRLVAGPNAIAGEWGHNPLPLPHDDERPGPACYCGRSGCIESWLSGPALAADHLRVTGAQLQPEQIAARASEGDPACAATLTRHADRLARGLAAVINILDPHVIVLGGGLSAIADLYHQVTQAWGRYIFSDHVATRLAPARHGPASGVRGAAWLWPASGDSDRHGRLVP